MKQNEPAAMSVLMSKRVAVALVALLAVAPLLDQKAVAGNGTYGGSLGSGAVHAIGSGNANHPKTTARNWITLHRPDGEAVHVNADQIVFVMSATALGGDKRANSKLQLTNGFVDVRESVEEVMRAVQGDALNQISDM
jgi:hypothetical protein